MRNLQRNFPSIFASQHRIDSEAVAHNFLAERGREVVVAKDGQCFRCHLELLALSCHLFVLHVSQQDAGAQIERIHEQIEVRIEASQVLCMVMG